MRGKRIIGSVVARKRLVAGNWKMNCTLAEARDLAAGLRRELGAGTEDVEVAVCPPFTALHAVAEVLEGSQVGLGAQNMYFQEKGAFTGEISPLMLLDAGCRYVILGHSERRRQMGETSEQVSRKLKLALAHGLTPIVCIGETWPERADQQTERVIEEQVRDSFAGIDEHAYPKLFIAYEPVWAIGTGQVATPDQAEEVHRFVRTLLPGSISEQVSILYGGSVTPENAVGLMQKKDLDGALVGGASLKADSFAAIVQAAC
jgi:triosephosphate isomerase